MAFDFGTGLSQAGQYVGKIAGDAALKEQQSDLDQQKLELANSLQMQATAASQTHAGEIAATAATARQTFEHAENTEKNKTELSRAGIAAGPGYAAAAAHRYASDRTLEGEKDRTQAMLKIHDMDNTAKLEVAKVRGELAQTARSTSLLSDDAIDAAAWASINTGKDPQSTGFQGRADKVAILNRRAQIMTENGWTPADMGSQQVNALSAQKALDANAKQQQAIENFGSTADKQAVLLLEAAKAGGADPTGYKVTNGIVQGIKQDYIGNQKVSEFNAVLTSWRMEMAKILSGSLGNVAASDKKGEEIDKAISRADTLPALEGVIRFYGLEKLDRVNSLEETRRNLTARAGQGATLPGKEVPKANIPAATEANPTAASPLPIKDGAPDRSQMHVNDNYMIDGHSYKYTGKPGADALILNKAQ
jgi:hypothetical protein